MKTPFEKATLYVWGTGQARHWFCPKCGVAVLRVPRRDSSKYSVNVRCLEGVDVSTLRSANSTGATS